MKNGMTFEEAIEKDKKDYCYSEDASTKRYRKILETKLDKGLLLKKNSKDWHDRTISDGYIIAIEELMEEFNNG